MLKLERLSHDREITIRLRGREPLMTKNLVWGLLIALFLHLSAFIFVEIRSTAPPPYPPIPQVVVDTDIGLTSHANESTILPQMAADGLVPRHVVEPEASYPEMPRMPRRAVNRRSEAAREILPFAQQFNDVEKLPYIPDSPRFSFIKRYDPIRINISGELAEWNLVDDAMSLVSTELKRPELIRRCTARFKVQVDGKKGVVFWYDLMSGLHDEGLEEIAKRLVTQLRFKPHFFHHLSEGEIEIQFQVPQSGPYDYLLAEEELEEEDIDAGT